MRNWREQLQAVIGPGLLAGITFGDWLSLLRANGFRVHPLFFPRAALIGWYAAAVTRDAPTGGGHVVPVFPGVGIPERLIGEVEVETQPRATAGHPAEPPEQRRSGLVRDGPADPVTAP